jgi:hypothetical protein
MCVKQEWNIQRKGEGVEVRRKCRNHAITGGELFIVEGWPHALH